MYLRIYLRSLKWQKNYKKLFVKTMNIERKQNVYLFCTLKLYFSYLTWKTTFVLGLNRYIYFTFMIFIILVAVPQAP